METVLLLWLSSVVRRTGTVQLEDGSAESSFQVLVHTAQDAHLRERVARKSEVLYMRAPSRCRQLGRVNLVLVVVVVLLLWAVMWISMLTYPHRFPLEVVLVGCRRRRLHRWYPAQRHTEIRRRGAKRVNLQPGHPVGREVGVQLVEDLGDSDGAGVVRQDDGARAVVVQQGGADLGVEGARVRRRGEAGAEAALEEQGEEVEGEAVRGRVDGLDWAAEELGEGRQRLLGQRCRTVAKKEVS